MEIVWDFTRQLDSAASPGNTTTYFDEMCQSFYVDSGRICTQIAHLFEGQWHNLNREPECILSETGYGLLDIEHQHNGAVYGVAQHGADVVFLIYEYMADVSTWLLSGSWQLQPDNPIKAGSIKLSNADIRRFEDSAYTLFSPGNRLWFQFRSGDSDVYDLGLFYIESSPYAELAKDFTFKGRNALGFFLSSQTFDERVSYSGTLSEVFTQLLVDAGVPEQLIVVQYNETTVSFVFSDSDTYLKGLQKACEQVDWYLDDLPDGKIVVGNESFIKSLVSTTGVYSFDRGKDVISRSVERSADGVYSRVCVRRKGSDPLSLYSDVPFFDGWFIGNHRTYYNDVPESTLQADMERILTQLVEGLQYSGITEKFESPFRPWLQTGDVAIVTGGDGPRIVGIITDIQHEFGSSGYFTSFVVTSGGTISNPDNPAIVASRYIGQIGGANRKRRLMDYIQIASKK